MPHVLQHTTSAGPEGVRHPGVHQVSEKEARALIAARAATAHTPPPKPARETAATGPKENATTTTKPPAPRGGP